MISQTLRAGLVWPSYMPAGNSVLALSLLLELWLVVFLVKRRVRLHFPLFFIFTAYTTVATAARLVTATHYRAYFYTFWWTEALLIVLSLAALHEVFYWMFEGFYQLWWFRVPYYGTIIAVVAVAIRNAIISPPVQTRPIVSLILDVGIGVNLLLVGMSSLFFALRQLFVVEFRRYAYGIVLGFGISGLGALMGYLVRSEFGTKLEFFARYSAAVGYILAVAIWISAFNRPEPEEDEWAPPMSPEQMREELQGYLKGMGISKTKR
jgi:hypothetical protein